MIVGQDNSQFIDDVRFSDAFEEMTGESLRMNGYVFTRQVLDDLANAVADDILQQSSRQLSYPVIPVPQKSLCIALIAEIVSVITLHVHGCAPKVPLADQSAHVLRHRHELRLVTYRELFSSHLRNFNERFRLFVIHRERLLDIDVAAGLKALLCQGIMTVGWRRDMDDVRSAGRQHRLDIVEVIPDLETLGQLDGHELFPVTHRDDPAVANPPDLACVFVGNLATADDSDTNHGLASPWCINSKYRPDASVNDTLGLQPVLSFSFLFEYVCF